MKDEKIFFQHNNKFIRPDYMGARRIFTGVGNEGV